MKALIKVGYGCNNHCTFCHTLDVRDVEGAAREVHRKIERARALGHTMVVLSGGEVTMRPELLAWASHTAALGMDFGLVTNGRMLAYRELVDRLIAHRLAYVYMSLHGGDARVHNLMVRADAFEQTYAAVKNLAGRGLDFTVNAVVTRHNLRHLRPIVDALLPYPDVVLKFSMVQPKGGGEKLFDHLVPPVREVAERVREAIAYGQERVRARGAAGGAGDGGAGGGLRFAHDGIPLCLLPGLEDLYDDLKTHRFATMVEVGEPDFFPVDDKNKTQTDKCRACALRGPCPGLYTGYLEAFGDGELAPVTDRPRSNSFTYVPEGALAAPRSAGAPCAVLADGTTPWDRGRHVFVRQGERLVRFRTASRDFADTEIEAVKHELGQLYLDVSSGKSAPDDFARDLRAMRRAAPCGPCEARDRCAGVYEPAAENVFVRDDARVTEALARLEGAVLDIGCGEAGPYRAVLEARARAGAIAYTGIDPDAQRVAELARRWPWARVLVGRAEELAAAGGAGAGEAGAEASGRFDHALVLRSWNHLRDPARVVAAIARLVRPGGTLTVVDNVAFGLLRTRAQAERAERSSARFEHYRNDGAGDAARVIEACGRRGAGAVADVGDAGDAGDAGTAGGPGGGGAWERVERWDVAPGTSNQWGLRYRRCGG